MRYESEVRTILQDVLTADGCINIGAREDLRVVGLDSLNYMSVIVALEDAFDVDIPPEKLGMRFVNNVYDICQLLEEVVEIEPA